MGRRTGAIVGATLVACGMLGSVGATTAGASASGTVKVFVTPNQITSAKHPGKVLLTGAIGDYGTVVSVNAAGKPTRKATYRLLKLHDGTIVVNIATFQHTLDEAFTGPTTLNKTTCSLAASASGAITIVRGTGSYAGITGSFTMTADVAGIAPRTKSGSCTLKTTSEPLATFTMITGTGSVNVP